MKKTVPSLTTTVNGKTVKVDKVVKTICPRNCFDTCGVVAFVKDGRMIKVEGDPDHPITRGHLCVKANTYVQRTYHKDRIKYPLLRVGKRGKAEFKRVSWDEAYDFLVDKLNYCKKKWGGRIPRGIPLQREQGVSCKDDFRTFPKPLRIFEARRQLLHSQRTRRRHIYHRNPALPKHRAMVKEG